ncbi:TetR/AcrR family transcriptional regulator [Clostridium felsineum]|uniref:TetR/AcrR family transcriptional regulator n=1 Tax=Clostridium felsineum TaxID=36839 RepID=UPI00214D6A07|nr:TetR/AcrR family transcriptional regulator [Clostridium felsineum]MCR3760672.1 TetR/AcrR family transcriptional regulator [Clostridium felsineum]
MSKIKSELQNKEILRLSNLQSNRITRECIESALILLMKEDKLKNISITDIVKRAGVSRTAYYRNYKSKEDILQNILKDIVDQIVTSMIKFDPYNNSYEFCLSMFNKASEYANKYKILVDRDFTSCIMYEMYKKFQSTEKEYNIWSGYKMCFWSGALYSILTKWIMNGMQQKPEDMARFCCQLISH